MDAVMPSSDVVLDERVADRTIHGQGTPERAWRSWEGLAALAPLSLERLAPRGARVVVMAPHPDDEVLCCGGALGLLARAGHEIVVVGVTDGEGSHPGSLAWTPTLLARQRRAERADGLERLGVPGPALELARASYEARYVDADHHRHIHGASLGVSSAAYLRVGGFAPLRCSEDVELVHRLRGQGAAIRWTNAVRVNTSARRVARAPDGFAAHLFHVERRATMAG